MSSSLSNLVTASQVSRSTQDIYEWNLLDAQYSKILTAVYNQAVAFWQSKNVPVSIYNTLLQDVEAATSLQGTRFFPTTQYPGNPFNYTDLAPLRINLLAGYPVADNAAPSGFDQSLADNGLIVYQWINLRLHRASGSLSRRVLSERALTVSNDAQGMSNFLTSAFSE